MAADPVDVNVPLNLAAIDTPAQGGAAPATAPEATGLEGLLQGWFNTVAQARAGQPDFASPLVTTTSLLENRLRTDFAVQHAGNGGDTTVLDGGRGLDVIVSDTEEIQVAPPPYDYYSSNEAKKGYEKKNYVGFGDDPVFRFKQRLLSSPEDQGNYVVSAWLQVGVPTGIARITNHAVTLTPTIGAAKGWGPFDVQATIGANIPTAYEGKIGIQIQGNVAFQYHLLKYFWPQIEFNTTTWSNGQRDGLVQCYFTPGVVISRFRLADHLTLTLGAGYSTAISPKFVAKPLTPAYDHAYLFSTRFGF